MVLRRILFRAVILSAAILPAGLPALPALPVINTNNVVVVTDYGASVNSANNASAIQSAINTAAAGHTTNGAAGGLVEIPAGIYLSGPLTMKSSVNLRLDAGAILRMLPIDQYPGGITSPANFINGSSLHDVAISGPGAIDGQGAPWWAAVGTNSAVNRPRMINLSGCNRLLIQNVTLSNSPMFHLAIGGSGGNKTVQGVTIRAPSSSHNTDACDVGGTNILVRDCDISVGDDDFTCGGSTWDVLLTNNVYGTGHGVSIGSYTDGGVSNFLVINCTFNGTDNGIRLKCQRGRGGLVRNLTYCNLTMTNVAWPLLVYSYYEFGLGTLTGVNPVFAANTAVTNPTTLNSKTPIWQNITFSNITATAPAGRPPLMVWGLPEALASNIVFRSVNITSSSTLPAEVLNATNIQFIDCNLNLPKAVKHMQFWNAGVIFSNSAGGPTATNLWVFDGLTTNGIGNSLQFFNAFGTLKNTNALDDGPLALATSTFTVSNNLTLFPSSRMTFTIGTNETKLAVIGNLSLGGTVNIRSGPGFTNGTYTVMTCTGSLTGSLPTLGATPPGYDCSFNTNTVGEVKFVANLPVVQPVAPAHFTANPTNLAVRLNWDSVAAATNYVLMRGTTSGVYPAVFSGLTATNYLDADVTNTVTYHYVVRAIGLGGESTNSLEVSASPLPSMIAPNLGVQISAQQLQLSWPQDHIGWTLQIQTNSLDAGLGSNWLIVPGSAGTNLVWIPITTTTPSVFLRLVY